MVKILRTLRVLLRTLEDFDLKKQMISYCFEGHMINKYLIGERFPSLYP